MIRKATFLAGLLAQINNDALRKISEAAHRWLDQNDSPMLRRIAKLKKSKHYLT